MMNSFVRRNSICVGSNDKICLYNTLFSRIMQYLPTVPCEAITSHEKRKPHQFVTLWNTSFQLTLHMSAILSFTCTCTRKLIISQVKIPRTGSHQSHTHHKQIHLMSDSNKTSPFLQWEMYEPCERKGKCGRMRMFHKSWEGSRRQTVHAFKIITWLVEEAPVRAWV